MAAAQGAQEQEGLYRGLGAREGFGSTDAPPPPEHAPVEDELTQRIRALLDHEEAEKEKAAAKAANPMPLAETAKEKARRWPRPRPTPSRPRRPSRAEHRQGLSTETNSKLVRTA